MNEPNYIKLAKDLNSVNNSLSGDQLYQGLIRRNAINVDLLKTIGILKK